MAEKKDWSLGEAWAWVITRDEALAEQLGATMARDETSGEPETSWAEGIAGSRMAERMRTVPADEAKRCLEAAILGGKLVVKGIDADRRMDDIPLSDLIRARVSDRPPIVCCESGTIAAGRKVWHGVLCEAREVVALWPAWPAPRFVVEPPTALFPTFPVALSPAERAGFWRGQVGAWLDSRVIDEDEYSTRAIGYYPVDRASIFEMLVAAGNPISKGLISKKSDWQPFEDCFEALAETMLENGNAGAEFLNSMFLDRDQQTIVNPLEKPVPKLNCGIWYQERRTTLGDKEPSREEDEKAGWDAGYTREEVRRVRASYTSPGRPRKK